MSGTCIRVNAHSIVGLNVKELFSRSRSHIWSLSNSNAIRTHNHLEHSTIWPNWPIYELCGCGFESRCCHKEVLYIFWTTWGISMKFSAKIWLIIILQVTKNQGFTLSLEDTFIEKPQRRSNWITRPSSRLRVKEV